MRNSSPVALGEIIADKYQVEGVLGEGGMGLVVSAWHLGLRQRVAIKLLLTNGSPLEDAAIERFQREARAAARIRSEHVCRVLDVSTLANGTPYLVMEYLEGCDLSDELARRGRLPVAEAVSYVLEACEPLAEAHLAGIIHRDLKPANLFLAQRPNGSRVLKLLDFGVSKSLGESSVGQFSLTKTSSLVGSPIYMSPEQLNSAKDVDARTDIWAIGAVLYELITGRTPFHGESIPQLVNAVLNTTPASFTSLGISAPAGLETVLRKALEKPRNKRYASVGELAIALGPFAPNGSISVSRILRVRASNDTRDPLPETVDDGSEKRKTPRSGHRPTVPSTLPPRADGDRRATLRWALLAVLMIALAGLAAVFSRRTHDVGRDEPMRAGVRDGGSPNAAASFAPPPAPPKPSAIVQEPPQAEPTAPAPTQDSAPNVTRPPPAVRPRVTKTKQPKIEESPSELPNFGGRR
jgi:eukaryotic-like serine/threonine-protein kinase